jgi:K+-sensing histidine kinase KdpD
LQRALRLVADTAKPFVTLRRPQRSHTSENNSHDTHNERLAHHADDDQGDAPAPDAGARVEAMMVAPIVTFDGSIWGAVVGVSADSDATAPAFRSIIQTAEQIGGQLSSWGRGRPSAGPVTIDSAQPVSFTSIETLLHELRTPLTGSLFALDIVERAYSDMGNETAQNALRTLRLAMTEATQVVQWWSETQRTGQAQPRIEPVSIEAVLRTSSTILSQYSSHTRFMLADDTPLVMADERMLKRVFLNLIDNAFRHGAPGGVLEISTKADGVVVQVKFLNEGVISDPALEDVLHPKRKPEKPSENRLHGLGLGIVDALVKGMGGKVNIDSDRRHWTAFIVTLPAARAESAPEA